MSDPHPESQMLGNFRYVTVFSLPPSTKRTRATSGSIKRVRGVNNNIPKRLITFNPVVGKFHN